MKPLFLWIIITLISFSATGQEAVSVSLKAAPFSELVRAVENQTQYKFFYRTDWTDSVSLTIVAEQEVIDKLLARAFEGTSLHFSIVEKKIFVTHERQLLTELPVDFFNKSNTGGNTTLFDYSAYEKLEAEQKREEEKVYSIGTKTSRMTGTATLSGYIKDSRSGEALVGATVTTEDPTVGVATDPFGRFTITLTRGRHQLLFKSMGMKAALRQIILYNDGKLDIELDEEVTSLKEVLVQGDRDKKVSSMQMAEGLDIKTMKQMPLALGEADVMKVVLALPGVQSVGEGTVGLNVRGGATNQNLILLNDAVIYNPSHLFGFFSTFNPDVLKNVELFKSGFTADYGGRLASVLDVQTREGNLKKFTGSGGISPITGRLTLEGPLVKEKSSILVGIRSTYSDWLLGRLDYPSLNRSSAAFYDVTTNVNHKINNNNQILISGYLSNDKFKLSGDTTYNYSDKNASVKWKHLFHNKLLGVFTGAFSQYSYVMNSEKDSLNAFEMSFSIKQFNLKADFSYTLNGKHTLTGGIHSTLYKLSPGSLSPSGGESLVIPKELQKEKGIESALYIGDQIDVSGKLSIYLGLRYSLYQYLGAHSIYQYSGLREVTNIVDTLNYAAGNAIATYHGPEPRVTARYLLSTTSSVKVSYNRTRQYIQMLSNTTAITPTDVWKLSDPFIKPQTGDQIAIGYYKNLKNSTIETSIEAYYKTMNNSVDYKDGAVLLLNNHIETDVIHAKGHAYGVEFLVKKPAGKLNGWVSYAYSRSLLQTKGNHKSETINNGEYYPSNYDKPHAVNFIGNFKFSRRINFSLNLVYSTGRPITLPIAQYYLEGSNRIYYSDRNAYRIPDYFRSDISVNIEGNHKIKKLAHSSWTVALYNLTGRRNAYSVFFVSQNGKINGYKLSVFGQPIPTITYNFKF
ncbi:MAG: TonB-dependent receptor [Bacteroidetes bacterium CHB5]|nr:TonB-dependent receptor [Bacteroidetes bacterium CHB5]